MSRLSRRQRLTILFGLISLVGIVLIAFALNKILAPQRLVSYENPLRGIKIKYPQGWKKIDNNPLVVVLFLSPKESDLDIFQENVSIIVQDLSAKPMDLKEYSQLAMDQVKQIFRRGIEVIESQPAWLAGQTAHRFLYQGTDQNNPELNLKMLHIWCIKDNKAYQFNYVALATKFDKYLDTVQAMANSLAIE